MRNFSNGLRVWGSGENENENMGRGSYYKSCNSDFGLRENRK